FADAIIERGAVCVIAGEVLARGVLRVRRDVAAEDHFFRRIHGAIVIRRGAVRVVRRAPGEPEEEGVAGLRVVLDVGLRIVGLGDGVVAVPFFAFGAVGVIERGVVGVGALANFPVVEALPALGWDVARAAMAVHVPFADAAGVVAGGFEFLGDGHRVG